MTYLIGAILLLLFIALILVFKPPKQVKDDEAVQDGLVDSEVLGKDEQLGLDAAPGESREAATDDGVLTFDKTEDFAHIETGAHEEEDLDLNFDEPGSGVADKDEFDEELELDLEEEGEEASTEEEVSLEPGSVAALSEEPVPVEGEESEEDIPVIVEEDGNLSPALGDVPEDYAQLASG